MAEETQEQKQVPTWEQAVEVATADAAQITSAFSPQVAQVIAAGVAAEPVIFGFAQLIAGIFKHHTSKAKPSPTMVVAAV